MNLLLLMLSTIACAGIWSIAVSLADIKQLLQDQEVRQLIKEAKEKVAE